MVSPKERSTSCFERKSKRPRDPEAMRKAQKVEREYRNNFASPFRAAELGYIDRVIFPENTRPRLIQALMMLKDKRESIPARRHGNVPL